LIKACNERDSHDTLSYPVWHSIDSTDETVSTQDAFQQVAYDFATLGEELIKEHLYSMEKSVHLQASESRRMAYKERWIYALAQKQAPTYSTQEGDWMRRPNDDTLIPTLSIEWTAAGDRRQLLSKTGYYIEVFKSPVVVLINRHYPHWRSAGMHYLQLLGPTVAFDGQNLTLPSSKSRQLSSLARDIKHASQEAKEGLMFNNPLARDIISQMSDYIIQLNMSQARGGQRAIASAFEEIAHLSKNLLTQEELSEGTDPEQVDELLTCSMLCLKRSFNPRMDDWRLLLEVVSRKVTEEMVSPNISEEIMDCFLIIAGLALANTDTLCGKADAVQEEQDMTGRDSTENIEETDDADVPIESSRIGWQTSSSRFNVCHNHDDFDNEDAIVWQTLDNSISTQRKRSSTSTSSMGLAKVARISTVVRPSLVDSHVIPTSLVDKDHFKKLVSSIMIRDLSQEQENPYDECAEVFKSSILKELEQAQQVVPEAIEAFHEVDLSEGCGNNQALQHMKKVEIIRRLIASKGREYQGELDWVILIQAHQANEIVKDLVDKIEDAYRLHYESMILVQSHGPTFKSPFGPELEKNGPFKDCIPFLEVIDEVRKFHDGVNNKPGGRNYRDQSELRSTFVVSALKQLRSVRHSNGQASTSISQLGDIPIPRVYMTNVRVTEKTKSEQSPQERKDNSAESFKETVFDVLFQLYFAPLVEHLTSEDLKGRHFPSNGLWAMKRRFLRFRLETIKMMVDECGIGTDCFAARCFSDFIFEPALYLPLPQEGSDAEFFDLQVPYTFPNLVEEDGTGPNKGLRKGVIDEDEKNRRKAVNLQGWGAIHSSVIANKDDILLLAVERAPVGARQVRANSFDHRHFTRIGR
jgi:hypothetical protein